MRAFVGKAALLLSACYVNKPTGIPTILDGFLNIDLRSIHMARRNSPTAFTWE